MKRETRINKMIERFGYDFNPAQSLSVLSLVGHQYNEFMVNRFIEHHQNHAPLSRTLSGASVKSKLAYLEEKGFTLENPLIAANVGLMSDIRNFYAHHMITPLEKAPYHLTTKDLDTDIGVYDSKTGKSVKTAPLENYWLPLLNLVAMSENDTRQPNKVIDYISNMRYIYPSQTDEIGIDLVVDEGKFDSGQLDETQLALYTGKSPKEWFYSTSSSTIISLMNRLIKDCPEFPY